MKPNWLKVSHFRGEDVHAVKTRLRKHRLHTVCEEARCPNLGECFSRGTATFLILGNICTRGCKFCNVGVAAPNTKLPPPDPHEPKEIAMMAGELGLTHVVITSVTRDDLPDEGAGHFAKCIRLLKNMSPGCPKMHILSSLRRQGSSNFKHFWIPAFAGMTVEILTPDFHARPDCLDMVCASGPHIFNHNVETVRRLTPMARSKADYDRSLSVLMYVGEHYPDIKLKSGIMVGLGETKEEVIETLKDLCNVGCDIVTIGQYLRPHGDKLPVAEYVKPEVFEQYKRAGGNLGIRHVLSGPLVRSSYMADRMLVF